MKHENKVKAILHIRPEAQFILTEDELNWLDETQTKPTNAQIETGWIAYQATEATEAEAKASAKATAQAKLAALGLTVEDLQALGL